jgi:hypothetical protein
MESVSIRMVANTSRTTYHVEASKLLYDLLDHLLYFWFQRDVRRHAKTAPPFALDLFNELIQFGGTWYIIDRDVEAVLSKTEGNRMPDSTCCTSNEGYFGRQGRHGLVKWELVRRSVKDKGYDCRGFICCSGASILSL